MIVKRFLLCGLVVLGICRVGLGQNRDATAVLTFHNDNFRTGQNTNETILTPANVGTNSFGKLFTYPVDGYVYAQPLVLTNVNIPGNGMHNVVFVATEHNSVYAFDADNGAGTNAAPLWHASFINPGAGVTTVPSTDVNCPDLTPEIGISSTPVIDPVSGTIYVVAKSRELTNAVTAYFYRLHALDVATGAEKFGGPVIIQPVAAGNGDGNDDAGHVPFYALREMNRAALLLNNGIVYVGFASHCDNPPYHGWLVGFDAQTLAQVSVLNTTPNGGDGGIWQAGGGPAADANGNIFLVTGNGTFDPPNNNYGDSFLRLGAGTNGLTVADYFTPYNQDTLNDEDHDVGSGGSLLLPDEAGSVAHPHLMVGASKEGTIYLVDRDNLGQFNPANDSQIVQELAGAIGGSFGAPAYFNRTLYYLGNFDALTSFPIVNGQLDASSLTVNATTFRFPGATPCISASGTSNAIVWVIQSDAAFNSGPAVLHAYDAYNVANELYNSTLAGTRDNPGPAVKFSVPAIANGKVYVGTQNSLTVFGNDSFTPLPLISPNGATFTDTITVTLTDNVTNAAIYYTLDGSFPTPNSLFYSGPFVLTNTALVNARAFAPGMVPSDASFATFLGGTNVGQGAGLTGDYFANQLQTFVGSPTLERIDPTINFDWSVTPPDPSIGSSDYTVRWTGAVQPAFNETYTFSTVTDDGVRLWVNNQLLINHWTDQSATEWSGSITLAAGQLYSIRMEYFQLAANAVAQLSWRSPSQSKTIIPATQLYPTFTNNAVSSNGPVAVLTYHNDNGRTGQNTNETSLNIANVNTNTFGNLFSYAVDGFIQGQPLVLPGVAIPGNGTHDVAFVATSHDSVYAFDANDGSGTNAAPLWQVSFINPLAGITPVPEADVDCPDVAPEIGVTSTPVIDPATGTLYVVAKTKEGVGLVTNYVDRLHALDVTTGAEKFGGPVTIQASVTGTGDGATDGGQLLFSPLQELNRAALLLNNNTVYIGYGSICDAAPFHGWLLGYDSQSLMPTSVFNATPNGSGGGIWQSGGGPACDANGNIFLMTGIGGFNTTNGSYAESFLNLNDATNGLVIADYFTPYNWSNLNSANIELGSGGVMLLPDEVGSTDHPHLLVGAGEQGTVYLLDRDQLGHSNPTNNAQIVQELDFTIGPCYCTPAYYNNYIYYLGSFDVPSAYPIANAVIDEDSLVYFPISYGYPGATPCVSANGSSDGILWLIQSDNFDVNGAAILHAYDANDLTTELYNSQQSPTRDYPGPAVKFAVPTIANGKVYVAGQYVLTVFGNAAFLPPPVITPAGGPFTNSVTVSMSDALTNLAIYYMLDGSNPTTNSLVYTNSFTLTNTTLVKAQVFAPNSVPSEITFVTFLGGNDVGHGTGLTGSYFTSQYQTFNGSPTLVRIDPTVNFDWTGSSPDPSISGSDFTVKWTGAVLPPFSGLYTFYTTTDDGARLWVNNQLLVDEWQDQSATEWSGTVSLIGGQTCPIEMDYYQANGAASAMLSWSSAQIGKTVIPQTQLYPVYVSTPTPVMLAVSGGFTNGGFQLQLSGPAGKSFVFQASTNLTNWISLSTNYSPSNTFLFVDPGATNFPKRFYRAVEQ